MADVANNPETPLNRQSAAGVAADTVASAPVRGRYHFRRWAG
jgi:hypothetical protein